MFIDNRGLSKLAGKTLFSVPHTERPELRRRLTEKAAELRKQGLGWNRIGEQLGVSGSQLYKWVSCVPNTKATGAQSKNPLPLGTLKEKVFRSEMPQLVLAAIQGLVEGRAFEETALQLGIEPHTLAAEWRRVGIGERGVRVLWKAKEWDAIFKTCRRMPDDEIAKAHAMPESEVAARRAFWREHVQLQHALDESIRMSLSGVSSRKLSREC